MKRLIVVTAVLLLAGCFSYSATIELAPADGRTVPLSTSELAEISETVGSIVADHNMVPDPRLPRISSTSRADYEWPERVIGLFMVQGGTRTTEGVAVWLTVDKETHIVRVVIRNVRSPRDTPFTRTLEESLTTGLSRAHPFLAFQVDSRTVGPALGP